MRKLYVILNGPPLNALRARVGVIAGHARVFTPSANVQSATIIRERMAEAMKGQPPWEGPVRLRIFAYYGFPRSWSQKKRDRTYWKVTKPDCDNVAKIYKDGMTGIVWKDDCQVVAEMITKRYTTTGERTVVEVEFLDENAAQEQLIEMPNGVA